MYSHLIKEALKEGIETIKVGAIVRQRDRLLLLELAKGEFVLPMTTLKQDESVQQALQRALIEETSLALFDVLAFLGHYDFKKTREYYFVVAVDDPSSIQLRRHKAYAWVDIGEAVGYPISDHLRWTLDLFAKLVS